MTFIKGRRVGFNADKRMYGSIIQSRVESEHECYLYKEAYLKTHTTDCEQAKRG